MKLAAFLVIIAIVIGVISLATDSAKARTSHFWCFTNHYDRQDGILLLDYCNEMIVWRD